MARIVSATARRLTALGFSLETFDPMNPKRVESRGRSSGTTRTPAWPTTIGRPSVTSVIATHRADLAATSTAIPQSISWSATSTQRPPSRTWVRWLVVL